MDKNNISDRVFLKFQYNKKMYAKTHAVFLYRLKLTFMQLDEKTLRKTLHNTRLEVKIASGTVTNLIQHTFIDKN